MADNTNKALLDGLREENSILIEYQYNTTIQHSSIKHLIEKAHKKEFIKYYFLDDMSYSHKDTEKVHLHWKKRMFPLTDDQYEEKYGSKEE